MAKRNYKKPARNNNSPAPEKKTAGNAEENVKSFLNMDVGVKNLIAYTILLITFFLIVYYINVPAKLEFHSDCTDTLMWAQAGYDAKSIYNSDFNYAALLPFSTGLIMQFFIGITGVSYTTHMIGMVGFLILFSAAFIFMLRQMDFDLLSSSIAYAVIVLLMSASEKLREIFWGHTIYYSLGLLFLFAGFGLIFMIYKKIERRKLDRGFTVCTVLLCLLAMLSSLNGVQALSLFVLPAAAAMIGLIIFDFDRKLLGEEHIRFAVVAALMLVFAVLGLGLGKSLAGDITAGYENAYSRFDPSDKWIGHLQDLLKAWLQLSGVDIVEGDTLMEGKSVINIIRIALNLLVVVIPVYRLFTYEKIKHDQTKMFLLAYWVITAFILIGWIFGKLGASNWRLIPILCCADVFFMMFVKELFEEERYRRLAVIYMLPLLIFAGASLVGMVKLERDFDKSASAQKLALLERNDCKYGYATFWNANVLSVLTGEKICVRCVEINDSGLHARKYQTQNRWFDDQPGVDEYFLLLTNGEYNDLLDSEPELIYGSLSSDSDGDYVLLKYDHNLF